MSQAILVSCRLTYYCMDAGALAGTFAAPSLAGPFTVAWIGISVLGLGLLATVWKHLE